MEKFPSNYDYELVPIVVKNCKPLVPQHYTEKSKYLITDYEGNFIGLAESLNAAQKTIEDHTYNEKRATTCEHKLIEKERHQVFIVILLEPETCWGKKWGVQESNSLSHLSDSFPISANLFYEQDYLLTRESERMIQIMELEEANKKNKKDENSRFLKGSLLSILLILWLFGAFSCVKV